MESNHQEKVKLSLILTKNKNYEIKNLMEKLKSLFLAFLILIFHSCNPSSKSETDLTILIPVSSDSIIAKFKTTKIRKAKLSQGASSYIDTTFNADLFLVKDTISEIRVDNGGKSYIILGSINNYENVKCYFIDNNVIDSLKVNQVITVSSNKHALKFQKIMIDTGIDVSVVEMRNCKLIK